MRQMLDADAADMVRTFDKGCGGLHKAPDERRTK